MYLCEKVLFKNKFFKSLMSQNKDNKKEALVPCFFFFYFNSLKKYIFFLLKEDCGEKKTQKKYKTNKRITLTRNDAISG